MRIASISKRLLCVVAFLLVNILLLSQITSNVFAATSTMLDGAVTIVNTNGTLGTIGTNSYIVQAEGGLIGCETVTLTISNASGSEATLAFDYAVTGNYGSFKIAGSTKAASGSYSGMLAVSGTLSVTVAGKRSYGAGKATLTLSNISLTAVQASSTVTLGSYDSALGSATVDGGTSAMVTKGSTVALVATANSGTTFLGWINESNNSVLSTSASYTLTPTEDITVKPVFVNAASKPWFGVGGATQTSEGIGLLNASKLYYCTASVSYLFDDLNAANTAAAASDAHKTIVLMNSGTLPAGDYTVSSGVTLLIPFDSSNTLYTTGVQYYKTDAAYSEPTEYRTLTMANGASITVNGAVSVSGKHRIVQGYNVQNIWGGAPMGALGFIRMEGNSNITVNSGGALYAYGFITGSGSVIANSGASVYEVFQITDYRGGDQSTQMQHNVFPVSQYYVQNIEVPLTLYSGAKEYGYTTVNASGSNFNSISNFIGGSDAMFNLSSGYVVKTYDGSKDRLNIEVYGNASLSSVEIELALDQGINSAEYVLALNGNITITIKPDSTATVNQDLALIPGSELIVEQDATVTLAEGKRIYIYDSSSWGSNYCHGPRDFAAVMYAPGRTYTRTTADLKDAYILVDGTIDASKGNVYTTNSITEGDTDGGANIHSTGTGKVIVAAGSETVTYQCINNSDYQSIPITSAQLKNGDGSYVQSGTGTYTYCSFCDAWMCNYATNVELGNNLNMYFAFWSNKITEETKDNYEVVVTHTDVNGKETSQPLESDLWMTATIKTGENQDQLAYVVYYKGLAASQMCDTVTVTLYKGTTAMHTWTDSIRDYSERMLDKYAEDTTKAELRTLIVDMLNYGAACQQTFKYNTGNLANANITGTGSEYNFDGVSTTAPISTYFDGSNLITTGNIQFAVRLKDGQSATGAIYSFTNHWGTTVTGQLRSATDSNGNVYYYVPGIVVADAAETDFKLTIKIGETVVYEDSIEAYCARMYNNQDATEAQKAAVLAFMKFSNSAKTYLEQTDGGRLE